MTIVKSTLDSVEITPTEDPSWLNKTVEGVFTREEKRLVIYETARSIVQDQSHDFTSKVTFDIENLSIRVDYDPNILQMLVRHPTLWFLFSSSSHYTPGGLDSIFYTNPSRFKLLGQTIQEYHEEIEAEADTLLQTATHYFEKEFQERHVPTFSFSGASLPELIEEIFRTSQGLSIGELHSQTAIKLFLLKYMQVFASHGVHTIFMENFFTTQQRDLDIYFQEETPADELPEMLKHNPDYKFRLPSGENIEMVKSILMCAKMCGIKRIVGIDAIESYHCKTNKSLSIDDRVIRMNYSGKVIIQREMPKMGKYLIFAGVAHAISTPVLKQTVISSTPPLSPIPCFMSIFGIPSMFVNYGDKESLEVNNGIKNIFIEVKSEIYLGTKPTFFTSVEPKLPPQPFLYYLSTR